MLKQLIARHFAAYKECRRLELKSKEVDRLAFSNGEDYPSQELRDLDAAIEEAKQRQNKILLFLLSYSWKPTEISKVSRYLTNLINTHEGIRNHAVLDEDNVAERCVYLEMLECA